MVTALLQALDRVLPARYLAWALCTGVAVTAGLAWVAGVQAALWWALPALPLAALGLRDVLQSRHAVLRNYPVLGHLRFLLEFIRPEIRQYFIETDREEVPFSRQQRALVYQRAKGEPDKRPFGTQIDMMEVGHEWINHSVAPTVLEGHDFRVRVGDGGTSCTQHYDISVFNILAMSFGAL